MYFPNKALQHNLQFWLKFCSTKKYHLLIKPEISVSGKIKLLCLLIVTFIGPGGTWWDLVGPGGTKTLVPLEAT